MRERAVVAAALLGAVILVGVAVLAWGREPPSPRAGPPLYDRGDLTIYLTPTPDLAASVSDPAEAEAVRAAMRVLRPAAPSRVVSVAPDRYDHFICGVQRDSYGPMPIWVVVLEGTFDGARGQARRPDGTYEPRTLAVVVAYDFVAHGIFSWPVKRDPKANCQS